MLEIYKGKKIFITGHTGFKGSWLGAVLKHLGAEYSGFALAPNTQPAHYEVFPTCNHSVIGDLADFPLLLQSLQESQPEIVFHFAAQPLVRDSYKNPVYTYQTNVMGTLNLLEAIKNTPSVKAVVIITTDKVYENKEWEYPYRETDELGGYDMYSSSKACTEILTNSYKRSFFSQNDRKIYMATARAGNVIGGGDWSTDRLIPDIVRATAGGTPVFIRNPKSIRPWQHVLDCLYGYLLLGEKLLEGNEKFAAAWNFAPHTADTRTVAEVVEFAQKNWNEISVTLGQVPDNYHEAGVLKLDNSRTMSELKWKPVWDTESAIEKTIEWYKAFYINNKILTDIQIAGYLEKKANNS